MDIFLSLTEEQTNWLKDVAKIIYGQKVKFAKDWDDGVADVIVFENNSYIWCLQSETHYVQGDGRPHFPRFSDKDEYYAAHARLQEAGFVSTEIGDFSESTGIPSNDRRIGKYIFLSYRVMGHGLDFEIVLEPEHDWAWV